MKNVIKLGLAFWLLTAGLGCSSYYALGKGDAPVWIADSKLGTDDVFYCMVTEKPESKVVCFQAEKRYNTRKRRSQSRSSRNQSRSSQTTASDDGDY